MEKSQFGGEQKIFFIVLMILLDSFFLVNPIIAQTRAFPGAEGYGRYAAGGRGGDVYHVTNLSDSGAGSLRYGIEEMDGPRTIVFDVSGTIMLEDRLKIEKPNLTIAGQTAPGDGITLGGDAFYVDASHVIVRYIRCRFGDVSGKESDAISVTSGSNIIFDHVTASWSVDETFSFQNGAIDSLTVQWCMVTESLRDSHHAKGKHGYGGIIGGLRQTVHHNLYAHHSSRNPKVTGRRHCEVDFRNNVIYNWGFNSCYDGTKSYLNWANNYYKSGPGTSSGVRDRIFQLSDAEIDPENDGWEESNTYTTTLYAEGNYVDGFPAITADNWSGGIDFDNGASEVKNRGHSPHNFAPITEQTAEEAYPLVLAGAGASFVRDAIDHRIVNEVMTGTVTYGNDGIIDSQDDVGGWPTLVSLPAPTDTDQDGMPDDWETVTGLNPNDPKDRNDDHDADGYTNLEEYLNTLEPPPLYKLTVIGGSGNGKYREGNTVNISAKEPLSGYTFDHWDGDIYSVNDAHESSTTVTMPASNVSLTAVYTLITGMYDQPMDGKAFHCFPNPSNGNFSIDLEGIKNSNIKIFNLFGNLLFQTAANNVVHHVSAQTLNRGIYLVQITDLDEEIYTQKIIIE